MVGDVLQILVDRMLPRVTKILESSQGEEQDCSDRTDDHERQQHWHHLGSNNFCDSNFELTGGVCNEWDHVIWLP